MRKAGRQWGARAPAPVACLLMHFALLRILLPCEEWKGALGTVPLQGAGASSTQTPFTPDLQKVSSPRVLCARPLPHCHGPCQPPAAHSASQASLMGPQSTGYPASGSPQGCSPSHLSPSSGPAPGPLLQEAPGHPQTLLGLQLGLRVAHTSASNGKWPQSAQADHMGGTPPD